MTDNTIFRKLPDVAERLGVSVSVVRKLIGTGELIGHKFGGGKRVGNADLAAYIEASKVKGRDDE